MVTATANKAKAPLNILDPGPNETFLPSPRPVGSVKGIWCKHISYWTKEEGYYPVAGTLIEDVLNDVTQGVERRIRPVLARQKSLDAGVALEHCCFRGMSTAYYFVLGEDGRMIQVRPVLATDPVTGDGEWIYVGKSPRTTVWRV